MTRLDFLDVLCDVTRREIAELLMPVSKQKGDVEQKYRTADVHKMRLPDSSAAQKKAPYIIHQLITSKDMQVSGQQGLSTVVVRSIFCVYSDNEEEGGLMLLNLMDRLRIGLLKQVVIGDRYELNLEAGLETLIYPDDTAPYYAGEMSSTWKLPAIKREVKNIWQ